MLTKTTTILMKNNRVKFLKKLTQAKGWRKYWSIKSTETFNEYRSNLIYLPQEMNFFKVIQLYWHQFQRPIAIFMGDQVPCINMIVICQNSKFGVQFYVGFSDFIIIKSFARKKLSFMNNIFSSPNLKINDGKGTQSNKIIRKVRQSEPNLIIEDPLFACKKEKGTQPELPKKLCKQPRLSEVLSTTDYNNQYFHSPQHHMIGQATRTGFHSPQYTKKAVMAKSLTSTCYDGETQSKNSAVKNAITKAQNKNRKSPIQNHKQTLNKIEEMLFNHGVKLPNSNKDKKAHEQNGGKVKASSYTKPRQKEMYFQQKPKSRQSQKTSPKPKVQQSKQEPRQLKETVSTQGSFKTNRKMISQFQIGKELGKGKFGVVKLVKHKKTGFLYSLKIIKKSVIQKEELMNQLMKQTKIQLYMNQSGIVKLYSVFDDAENVYLLMQLCCQGNLYQYMKRKGKIPESETKVLIKSICEGLAELHHYNIIHRDLKPENIVLCYGMTKICDFGWSTQYKDVMRQTFCGTPLYVSPELLSGNCYDEKVDLWAIGVLTYEMLTGHIPFEIKSQRDLSKIVSTKIVYPSTMSNEAVSFLGDLLAKDPKNRKGICQILNHPFLETRKQPK